MSLLCREKGEEAAPSPGCHDRHCVLWCWVSCQDQRPSLCHRVRLIKELGSLLILRSPKLGLWHDSNEDWLISQSTGTWKTQNVVVQGCMFRFWILWLAHRFGMCDKTEYKAFGWLREVFLYDGSGKVTLQVKSLAVLSAIILFFSEFLNKKKYENAEVKF